jgi:tetratricopeptide (TPR) repeat protein
VDHRQTLYRMNKVAGILHRRGDVDEAESLLRETLMHRRRALGEDDPATIGSRFNLAVWDWRHGRYDEAESMFRETLEIGGNRFGEASQLTVFSMINLAGLYELQGRYDEAESWRRRLLEIQRRSQGELSPAVARTKAGLARILRRQGRRSEAETLCMEALETAQRLEDPRTEADSHLELARLYMLQGDHDRADSHLNQFLVAHEGSGSDDGAAAVATYYVLADDHDTALRYLKEAVELGYPRAWIETNLDFAPLRGNPGFETILAEPNQ